MNTCQLCDAPLAFLGILGNLTHTRCTGCGMDFNHPTTQEDIDFNEASN